MNSLYKKMTDTLIDLKENFCAVNIKAEYEDEGTSFDDLVLLKELAEETGFNLSIKIGGCGALKDIYDAEKIGASAIVAPMIESPYALKKYTKAIKSVFLEQKRNEMNFYINIETKNGLEYLDEILNCEDANYLNGIVLGRTDLTESMGMNSSEIDSEIIFNMTKNASIKAKEYNKEFIIGGGVSLLSVPFFKGIADNYLTKYETRKIVFDAQKALENNTAEQGIRKALEFELMWLKNKSNQTLITEEENKRIQILEARIDNH